MRNFTFKHFYSVILIVSNKTRKKMVVKNKSRSDRLKELAVIHKKNNKNLFVNVQSLLIIG